MKLPDPEPDSQHPVTVRVRFYSYYKDLAGCAETTERLPDGATIELLLAHLFLRFPKLAGMQNSTLIAVGVEYQPRSYTVRPGDEISLFPPVQGG